jgi:hypothetical protein
MPPILANLRCVVEVVEAKAGAPSKEGAPMTHNEAAPD